MTFDYFQGIFNQTPYAGNDFYAQLLYAQAVLETGRFDSNLFNNHANMFGMRPAQRRTKFYTSVYESANGEFASYPDPLRSLLDRIDLDEYNDTQIPSSGGKVEAMKYYNDINRAGYTPEADYPAKLVDTLSKLANNEIIIDGGGPQPEEDLPDVGFSIQRLKQYSPLLLLGLVAVFYWWWKNRK